MLQKLATPITPDSRLWNSSPQTSGWRHGWFRFGGNFPFPLHALTLHLQKKMLLLNHIWGWNSVPLLRSQPHMFWLHSGLLVQIRPCLYKLGSCSLHWRSTDGSTASAGWNSSRLDLFRLFFSVFKLVLSFYSALTGEVVFTLAHKIIRSNFNIRFPIATLSHALLLCWN